MTRVTLLIVLALSTSAVAQQRSDEMISKDLVKLLLGGFGYGAEDIKEISEGAPDDFPEKLLPQGARPLVSMATARSTTVVAEAPGFTAADVPRYERQMAAAGWSRPAAPAGGGMRGLISPSAMPPSFFCSGDRFASYTLSRRPGGGSWIRIFVRTRAQDFDPCRENPAPNTRVASRLFEEFDMPRLMPPAGSRASGAGGSSGSDFEDQRMRFETTLTAAELVEHYASQLTNHGWTQDARAVAEDIVIARFRHPAPAGKDAAVATITAVAVADGDVDVSLRLMRVTLRRR